MQPLHKLKPRSHLDSWQFSHSSQSSTMPASALSRSILRASRKASRRSAAVHSRTGLLSRNSRRVRASASDCVEELKELSDLSIFRSPTQVTNNDEIDTQWRVWPYRNPHASGRTP